MLNLQNLNPQAGEPKETNAAEKNVINSMYNILKDDGINVKWNSDGTITLFRPSGLSSIHKIKFREFIGELLPITNKQLPELKAVIETCYNGLNSGYILTLSNPFNNIVNLTPLNKIAELSHDWQYSADEDSQVLYNLRLLIEEANRKLQKLFYPINDTVVVSSDLVTSLGSEEVVYDTKKIILPSGLCSNICEYYEGGTLRFPKISNNNIEYDEIIEYRIPTGALRKIDYNRVSDKGAMLYLEAVDTTGDYQHIDHNIKIYYEVDYSQAWSYYTQITYEVNKSEPLCDIYKTLGCVSHQTFRLNTTIPELNNLAINTTLCAYFDQDYNNLKIINPYGKVLNVYIHDLFGSTSPLYPQVGDVQRTTNNLPYILSVGTYFNSTQTTLSIAFILQQNLQESNPRFVIYRIFINAKDYFETFQYEGDVDATIFNYNSGIIRKSDILARQPNFYNLLDMVNGSIGEIVRNEIIYENIPVVPEEANYTLNGQVLLATNSIAQFEYRYIYDFCIFPNITITDNSNTYKLYAVSNNGSRGLYAVKNPETLPYSTYADMAAILSNGGYIVGTSPAIKDGYGIQLFADSSACGYCIPYYNITNTDLYYDYNYLGLREAYIFGYDERLYIDNSTINNLTDLNNGKWIGAYLTSNNNTSVDNRDFIVCQELNITEDGKIEGLLKLPVLYIQREGDEQIKEIPFTLHIFTEPNTINLYTTNPIYSGFEIYTLSNVNNKLTFDGLTPDIIQQLETELLFKYEYNDIELTVNGFPNGDGIVYHLNDISRIDFKEYQTDNTTTSINITLSQNGEKVDLKTISEYFGKLYVSIDWEQ